MSKKVRTDADILVEGTGDDYGWVSDNALYAGTLGDYDPGGSRPSWWVGSDQFDGYPIGPNGPGESLYGWDTRGAGRGGWWNTPRDTAGLLAAVTRCTTVIVNPIVRTPWQIVSSSRGVLDLPAWVTDPCRRQSVPGQSIYGTGDSVIPWGSRLSSHEFWQTVLTHAIWFGRGAFMCQEDDNGRPLAGSMMIVNPYMIANQDGFWVIDPYGDDPLVTDFEGRFYVGGFRYRLYVMRGLPPNNERTPEGVLQRHFDTLRLGISIHSYQLGSFGNGVPPGYLKVASPNFDEDKADALKRKWMDAHGGDKKSIAVLNGQVDFTAISLKPVDNDTTNLKQANLVDVAHAFGLSAVWVDSSAGYSLTYSNTVDKRRELLDLSLTGWGQQLMEMLNACLAYGSTIRIQWDRFTAPDLVQQIPSLVQAVDAGLMTRDEARTRLGLMPIGMQEEQ